MERKIGEIFELGGEWYQCIEQPEKYDGTVCSLCAFQDNNGNCELELCSGTYRNDKKSVIFKKLEKVGEPITVTRKCYGGEEGTYVEIKTKEDMKENKLNLKPFDLEAARSGKPVCTREGRPARIICFDRKGYRKIVALVHTDYYEDEIIAYTIEGHRDCKSINTIDDLMMAPERHEGWINVYKGGKLDADYIYPTKADALENIFQPMKDNYIDTIKLTWEE